MNSYQFLNGVLDILAACFGIFAVRPSSHNLLCLACYLVIVFVYAVFTLIILLMRVTGVPLKSLVPINEWQTSMAFIVLCVALFVYVRLPMPLSRAILTVSDPTKFFASAGHGVTARLFYLAGHFRRQDGTQGGAGSRYSCVLALAG